MNPTSPMNESKPHRPSRLRPWMLAPIAIALVALGAIPRFQADGRARQAAAAADVTRVTVTHPQAVAPTATITLPGTLQPWAEASVRARSSGYVASWQADIGSRVKAGQLLATVVAPELDAALRQARSDEANAQANVDIAQVSARRWADMLARHATSAQEADQRQADLASRQALLASAKANTAKLAQSVAYTRIVAPFDGVVTVRNVDVGTLVDANAPTELFHVMQSSTLRTMVSVPDDEAAGLKPGMAVGVLLGTRLIDARISRSAASLDVASRMLRIEIDVPNPDGSLLPGQFVQIRLDPVARMSGSVLPVEAVLYRPGGPQVALVGTGGQVTMQKVRVARDLGTQLVVTPPLPDQAQVVAHPGDSIAGGQVVQVTAPPPSGAASGAKGSS